MKKALLVLESGQIFNGTGHGACGTYLGELVFTTAMTGYVEALTDPSYIGQLLVFAYPLIGNYGVDMEFAESKVIQPEGIVCSEICTKPYKGFHLDKFLLKNKVGGISQIDTRQLVRLIAKGGSIKSVLTVFNEKAGPITSQIADKKTKTYNRDGSKRIVLIDYGYKKSILENLIEHNNTVIVVSKNLSADEILKYKPAGVVLSNGPGDPSAYIFEISVIQKLLQLNIPILGICLGHQLLGLAIGGETYKMQFGHRGLNQPVQNLTTKKAYITSQNHGYAIKESSLPKDWIVTHINLNDRSIEGIKNKTKPWFSIQFHPEANPGPHDSKELFNEFFSLLK